MKNKMSKLTIMVLTGAAALTFALPKLSDAYSQTNNTYTQPKWTQTSKDPSQGLLGPVSVKKEGDNYYFKWEMSDRLRDAIAKNTNIRPYFNVYDGNKYNQSIDNPSIVKIEGDNIVVKLPKKYFELKKGSLEYNIGIYSKTKESGPGSKSNPISGYHGDLWFDIKGKEENRLLEEAHQASKRLVRVKDEQIALQDSMISVQEKKYQTAKRNEAKLKEYIQKSREEKTKQDSLMNSLRKNGSKSKIQIGAGIENGLPGMDAVLFVKDKWGPYISLGFGEKDMGTSTEITSKEKVLMGSNTYKMREDSISTSLTQAPSFCVGLEAVQKTFGSFYVVAGAGMKLAKETSKKTGTAKIIFKRGEEILEEHKLGNEEVDVIPSESAWKLSPDYFAGIGANITKNISLETRIHQGGGISLVSSLKF